MTTKSYVPALLVSGDVWHARLGHTSSRVLGSLSSNKSITCTSAFPNDCVGCKLRKIHRLPFEPVEHVFLHILYLKYTVMFGNLHFCPIIYIDIMLFLLMISRNIHGFLLYVANRKLILKFLYFKRVKKFI